jgi:hypothetical protein
MQAVLEAAGNIPMEKVGPCDTQKLIKYLQLRESQTIDDIPNESLRHILEARLCTRNVFNN